MPIGRILVAGAMVLLLQLAGGCARDEGRTIRSGDAAGTALLDANIKDPGDNALGDADIQTILDDNVGAGGQADGLVVGVVDDDARGARVISAGTLGDGTGRTVDGDTVFEIGSITKVFTGLLLLDMVDRGEMRLDDPVQKYLPAPARMPTRNGRAITLFDLATHTSGLPRDGADLGGGGGGGGGGGDAPRDTPEQLYAALSRHKLRCEPSTHWEYSNLAVGLLGHVIALKAGKDYETLVIERICRPLGMDSTRVTMTPALQSRAARGHAFPGRPMRDTRCGGLLDGCGALRSTGNDLLKFVSANLGLTQAPLTPLLQKMHGDVQSESGRRGRLIWTEDAGVLVHGGLVGGFRANLGFDPAKRRGVVILANCCSTVMPFGHLAPFLNHRSPRPPRTAAIDPVTLDGHVGVYRFDHGQLCSVRRAGERVLFQVWRHGTPRYPMPYPAIELFPQSSSVFYSPMWDTRVRFARNTVVIDIPREGVKGATARRVASRLPDAAPDQLAPDVYEGLAGQYRPALLGLIPVGPTLNLYLDRDELGAHVMAYVQGLPGPNTTMRGELFPFSRSTLFATAPEPSLTVRRDKRGTAAGVIVHLNGQNIRGVRVSDRPVRLPRATAPRATPRSGHVDAVAGGL